MNFQKWELFSGSPSRPDQSGPVLKLSWHKSQFEAIHIIQFNAKTETHVSSLLLVLKFYSVFSTGSPYYRLLEKYFVQEI